jgi:riboflavin synthase
MMMFTGIIQAIGQIGAIELRRQEARITIEAGKLNTAAIVVGDSIAVNGVCLTVVNVLDRGFCADVSQETLVRTTLGEMKAGMRVNLEQALTLHTPLGGHLVSGHVDGVGVLTAIAPAGESWMISVQAPADLARYIAEKGSICLDGVSLTVNRVEGAHIEVNLVPYTLKETVLGAYQAGQRVNLEVDLIARYLERLLLAERGKI